MTIVPVDPKFTPFLVLWSDRLETASFCQNPVAWLDTRKIDTVIFPEINWEYPRQMLYRMLQIEIFIGVLGRPVCKGCGKYHQRISQGWSKGWAVTCSKKCQNIEASARQTGSKNTSHRMSDETRKMAHKKQSAALRKRILEGTYTPKTENYLTHRMIRFRREDGREASVRSLWELIFWLEHPHLEYEVVRIPYICQKTQLGKIYIADFYHRQTHTVYEVKPQKYQLQCKDKSTAAIALGYNFVWIGEKDITRNDEIEKKIRSVVCDVSQIESRLQWIRRVKK